MAEFPDEDDPIKLLALRLANVHDLQSKMRLDSVQDLLLGQGVIKSESGARVGAIAEPLGGEPRRDAMTALKRHKKIQLGGSTYPRTNAACPDWRRTCFMNNQSAAGSPDSPSLHLFFEILSHFLEATYHGAVRKLFESDPLVG